MGPLESSASTPGSNKSIPQHFRFHPHSTAEGKTGPQTARAQFLLGSSWDLALGTPRPSRVHDSIWSCDTAF